MLNFSGRRTLPVIVQSEASECGLACLAMVASYYGHRIDLNTLRRQHPISMNGVTLRSVIEIARHLNFTTRAVRLEPEDLKQLKLPAILHWDMNHFVVLRSVGRRGLVLHDPAIGEKNVSWNEASKHLTGVALELTPTASFERKDERARLGLSTFLRQASGAKHALFQILALSRALELLVIAGPFYLQVTVDEVIARGDVPADGAGAGLRPRRRSHRRRDLAQVADCRHPAKHGPFRRHLIRLPLSFFEKRHIGDVLSRFTSIEPVRDLISESLILAIIDGMMVVITLAVMFAYSTKLTLIVLAAFFCYAVIRIALFRYLRDLSERMIQAKANETSNFVESLRAMQSIKLFNHENEREGQWLNRFAETVNADVRLERAKIGFLAANGFLFGVENILIVYFAAQLALANIFTIGMVFAFITYKQIFINKANLLLEKALDFGIVGLHLERLSDIALTPLEAGHNMPLLSRPVRGALEVRDVSFRYSETEDFVLENVNFAIGPGESATIMGPWGCGKTTLMKVMLGLLHPTSGEVFIDGIPLRTLGVRAYRDQIAAVMQDDQLLSGSIADNICFFTNSRDEDWMRQCAQMAGIHDDILRMPMAYNSLIGDMGNTLSGGQRQRVILARALYRRPKILFLDEATAHLDTGKEREISQVLQELKITRINIAHRSELAGAADVMLRFEGPEWATSMPARSRAIAQSAGVS